jgi:superfamily II DNA or RNA helicase
VTTLNLRGYQVEAIEACRAAWALGQRRLLVSWPTGAGKTVLFSHVIKERLDQGQRCLVIAHRGELLDQAMRTMLVVDPWTHVGRVQASKDGSGAQVVYASIQTIANAKRRARLGSFGLVVVDEVHHASARTYREVLAELGCWADDGPDLLGVTATMDRSDGKDLGHIFDVVAHSYGITDAIDAGYLVPPRGRLIATDLDMSKVRTTAGDFNAADLGAEMERVDIGGAIVRAWTDWASERARTVVFVPLVAIAENVASAFQRAGVDAAAVHGSMKPAERRKILSAGHRVLVNAMLLTEGWDDPEVDCIVWARPTQSRALFQQSVGRGLRLHPSKQECLVLDLIGSSGTHDLAGVSTLYPPGAVESAIECLTVLLAPPGHKRRASEVARLAAAQGIGRESLNIASRELELEVTMIDGERWVALPTNDRTERGYGQAPERPGVMMLDREALGGADVVGVDMMSRARFAWQRLGDGWALPGGVRLVPADDLWAAMAGERLLGDGLDLPTAMGIAEDHVRATGGAVLADRQAPWRQLPPTDKQAELLRRFRRSVPETRGEAAALLDRLFAQRKGR